MKNKTLLLARTLIKNGEGLGIRGSSTFTKVALILVFAILIPGLMTEFHSWLLICWAY